AASSERWPSSASIVWYMRSMDFIRSTPSYTVFQKQYNQREGAEQDGMSFYWRDGIRPSTADFNRV
ncbi:hypothetical protein ASD32_26115, partial [Rhizobium sp. Root483D2]